MMAIDRSARPSVLDTSGERFSVQLTYTARRSLKSHAAVSHSSCWRASRASGISDEPFSRVGSDDIVPQHSGSLQSPGVEPTDAQRRAGRLAGLGTTVFTEMTALAARTAAINLGQGFPDSDGPPEVIEAAIRALRGGQNQYAPLPGVPALRTAIFEHQLRCYGLAPDDVLVTFGATEAIAASLL